MPMARNNIWTCDVFAPDLLSILVFQPILFHTIVTEGHYMLCSIEKFFFKKVEQSCWLWCGKWHVKGHTFWCALCFVLLVQFVWFIWKIFKFVWLCQRLVSLSFKKTTIHINLLEKFFCEIDVCVYPPLCWLCLLSDILAPHDSNIDSLCWLFCIVYIYAAMVYIRHYFISWLFG